MSAWDGYLAQQRVLVFIDGAHPVGITFHDDGIGTGYDFFHETNGGFYGFLDGLIAFHKTLANFLDDLRRAIDHHLGCLLDASYDVVDPTAC